MGEDGLKGWQMDEMQGRAKERIKEGQYINKSLFFLTQVIARKAEDKRYSYMTEERVAISMCHTETRP